MHRKCDNDKHINLHDFYLGQIFGGYVEKMPSWLKKEADQELEFIYDYVEEYEKSQSSEFTTLDIGCGNCRIYKDIPRLTTGKSFACDIFYYKELPNEFKNWLRDYNVKYQRIDEFGNWIPMWGKFDIITCYGTDVHLSALQVDLIMSSAMKSLKPGGILIWQVNRKDTLKGRYLKWKDRALEYQYRPKKFYFPYEAKFSSKVSHIYVYRAK